MEISDLCNTERGSVNERCLTYLRFLYKTYIAGIVATQVL
jgi:hypothetical protein